MRTKEAPVLIRVRWRRLPSGTVQLRFRRKGKKEVNLNFSKELTDREAEREQIHYEREISLGKFDPWDQPVESPLLKDAVSEYISEKEGRDWNPTTSKETGKRLRQMCDNLPNKEVDQIRDWEWYEQPKWSAYTKKGFYIITRAFRIWCDKKKYATYEKIPLRRITRVEANEKKLKAITPDQLDDICQAYSWQCRMNEQFIYKEDDFNPERHIQLWHVIFKLLLRKAEIPKVTIKDLEEDYITINGKGGKKRRLFIYDSLRPHIDWFRKNQIHGKPFFGFSSMQTPTLTLRKASKLALGLDFEGSYGFHTFRHGGITHMINQSVSIPVVSEYAGHASVSITLDRYAHVIDQSLKSQLNTL